MKYSQHRELLNIGKDTEKLGQSFAGFTFVVPNKNTSRVCGSSLFSLGMKPKYLITVKFSYSKGKKTYPF